MKIPIDCEKKYPPKTNFWSTNI
jgi:hypothetical protein